MLVGLIWFSSSKAWQSLENTCDCDFLSWTSSIDEVMQQYHFLVPWQAPGRHCTRAFLHCNLLVVAIHCVCNIQLQDKQFDQGSLCAEACDPGRHTELLATAFISKLNLGKQPGQEPAGCLHAGAHWLGVVQVYGRSRCTRDTDSIRCIWQQKSIFCTRVCCEAGTPQRGPWTDKRHMPLS